MITTTPTPISKFKLSTHKSVLLEEVLTGLAISENDIVVDGTLGGVGHGGAIVSKLGKNGVFVGLDQDEGVIKRAKEVLVDSLPKVIVRVANFRDIDTTLRSEGINKVNKILLDLGFSTDQLEHSGRGLSFLKDEPLVMTLHTDKSPNRFTARDILNEWDEENIATVIKEYGEESFAKRIAKAIVKARAKAPIERTGELVSIIKSATPIWYHHRKTHPATKTFQALRITVNDEIEVLRDGLLNGFSMLTPKGRMAVISFHSLEDRIVKHYFKEQASLDQGIIITKKPIIPSRKEVVENPRARSAKLRIIEKV